jgi:flagellar motor switch protein FliN/FliY
MVNLRIELGRARIGAEEASKLRAGAVVPLDGEADDLVEVYADGKPIARGELMVIDGKIGVRVVETMTHE